MLFEVCLLQVDLDRLMDTERQRPVAVYNVGGIYGGTGMTPDQVRDTADRARHIYDQRLRAVLEADHPGRFVAVEPDSGDHFLADTLDAAADAAQAAHPDRRAHVLRVGHPAAWHIGGAQS